MYLIVLFRDLSKNQISTIDTYTFKTLSNLKRL